MGASAQRGGSTGFLNSEGEGYYLRALNSVNTAESSGQSKIGKSSLESFGKI